MSHQCMQMNICHDTGSTTSTSHQINFKSILFVQGMLPSKVAYEKIGVGLDSELSWEEKYLN